MKRRLPLLLALSLTVLTACSPETTTTAPTSTTQVTETSGQTSQVANAVANVVVTVEGQEIEGSPFQLIIEEDQSLLDAMKAQLTIEENDGFVTSIQGNSQDPAASKYWLFDVNGSPSEVGASEVFLKDKDQVEWKLDVLN